MATKPIPKLPLFFVYRGGARAPIDGGDKPTSRSTGTISNGREDIEDATGTRFHEGGRGQEDIAAGDRSTTRWNGAAKGTLGIFGIGA
jgi:hypothetical protein